MQSVRLGNENLVLHLLRVRLWWDWGSLDKDGFHSGCLGAFRVRAFFTMSSRGITSPPRDSIISHPWTSHWSATYPSQKQGNFWVAPSHYSSTPLNVMIPFPTSTAAHSHPVIWSLTKDFVRNKHHTHTNLDYGLHLLSDNLSSSRCGLVD